jgi:phosphinothricin acetyltransferase
MSADVAVRPATEADFDAITAIYARHVREGIASFEETPPDRDEMLARWHRVIASGCCWLVAESEAGIRGYAYTGLYHARVGWRFTVEDSIYLAHDAMRRGYGRALLSGLIDYSRKAGHRRMLAVIGDSDNAGSVGLHASFGFRHVGTLTDVGYKFGRWVDVVMMQLDL